jgi:hypothetical protein
VQRPLLWSATPQHCLVCFCKPAKAFTPVNSSGRRVPLLEPTKRRIQWNEVAAASSEASAAVSGS